MSKVVTSSINFLRWYHVKWPSELVFRLVAGITTVIVKNNCCHGSPQRPLPKSRGTSSRVRTVPCQNHSLHRFRDYSSGIVSSPLSRLYSSCIQVVETLTRHSRATTAGRIQSVAVNYSYSRSTISCASFSYQKGSHLHEDALRTHRQTIKPGLVAQLQWQKTYM